jgi:adenylate cyclase
MAYWNAPTDIKNHADKAIESAILQIKTLKKLNKTLQKNFTITLNIGIGINTGVATIGEIGSKGRSDYTAIGDSVNLASRLEGLNKFYKTNIIISEFTKNNLTKKFNLRELDIVKVKGKGNATKIFEVVIDNKEYKSYKLGLEEYRKQNLKKALELFEKEIEISNDEVSKIYAKRCKEILNKEKEFKLIQEFLTK